MLGKGNWGRRGIGGGVALLLGLATAACEDPEAAKSTGPATPPPAVTVATVGKKAVTASIDYVGRIEAIDKVELRARVSGFLLERNFVEGSNVDEGQLLFTIDPAEFKAKVDLAEANVAEAKANLVEAEKTVERNQQLLSRGNVSEAVFDEAVAQRDGNAAKLKGRQAELTDAEIQLDYTSILSPLAGHIGAAAYTAGNLVEPASGVLATVTKLDPIYASFTISEREYIEIQKARTEAGVSNNEGTGKFVPTLVLPDGSDYPTPGTFNLIGDTVDPSTGTVMVRTQFDNPDRLLLPGQFVSVIISTSKPTDSIVVPQAAVQEDQQGAFVLSVDGNDEVIEKRVETGQKDGYDWVIQKGLDTGETIIVEGVQKVRAGVKVKPVFKSGKPEESGDGEAKAEPAATEDKSDGDSTSTSGG